MMEKQKRKRILVVDDSAAVRGEIRRELVAGGCNVDEAQDGLQALVKVSTLPAYDLITLDVEMPFLNGFETCRKLSDPHYSRKYRETAPPVIFLTSNDTMESRKKGFECGAAKFIVKPFKEGKLLAAVKRVLGTDTETKAMTALVVDDSEASRKIVSQTLETMGLDVYKASDGLEAFEIIRTNQNKIDIVITDLIMPTMDGAELTRKIRKELCLEEIPIIFLTAVGERSQLLKVFKAGATDYLVKPFAQEELIARIDGHLERNRLNRRLRLMVDELKALNSMKDNLLAVCSHDLRSPLNGILGYTELLLKKEYIEREDREGLYQIRESGLALLGYVEDILNLSKVRSGKAPLKMSPVSLESIIKTSITTLKNMAESKNQTISLVNLCSEDQVEANPSGLSRVMNNLISNAIKYTPAEGRITITIEPLASGDIGVEVADSGMGIEKDKLPYLFDPFTRISRTGTSGEFGVGLGMSIVKEILDRHGASIDVASQLGQGTVFRLTFQKPDYSDKAKPPRAAKKVKPSPAENNVPLSVKGRRVLLVEDDPINQKLSLRVLKELGVLVELANNGREALETLSEAEEKFDLVFMDRRMPIMDGIETAREIRKKGFDQLPIVGLSADAEKNDKKACIEAGMNDCVAKPIRAETVMELLDRFLPEPIVQFNLDSMAAKARMKKDEYLKYLKLFCNSARVYLDDLEINIEKKDTDEAAGILHSIKGGALSLGLDEIRQISEKLEMMARKSDFDGISDGFGKLRKVVEQVAADCSMK